MTETTEEKEETDEEYHEKFVQNVMKERGWTREQVESQLAHWS